MEHISKMAIEVNKLIGGKLLAGKSVYLPEVGSLYVIMNSQQRKRVEYCSAEQGDSIVDIIIARAKCSDAEGQNIYNRYLEEVRQGTQVSLASIGELRGKSFATSDSFAKQLNDTPVSPAVAPIVAPVTAEPKPIHKAESADQMASPIVKPLVGAPVEQTPTPEPKAEAPKATVVASAKEEKKSKKVCIIILLLLILLLIGDYYIYRYIQTNQAEAARIEALEVAKAKEAQRVADSIKLAQEQERLAAEAAKENEIDNSGQFHVVYNVFSKKSNAERAVRDINKRYGEGSAHTYKYGESTLVSMFESDNRAECQRFLMKNYDEFPDTWIYDRKK